MTVRQIDTRNRRDVRCFVEFPLDLHAGCEQFTPPLLSTVRLALNRRRHPFYKHSDAAFFLAEQDGAVVGRLGVFDHQRYNAHQQSKVAFFYYFDAIDDVETTHALFDAAAAWARGRGLTVLKGPKGMMRSDPYGILIEGFQYTTAMGMPYNYAYYAHMMKALGFEKEVDYLSGYVTGEYELPERLLRLVDRIKERRDFWVKSFRTKRELRRWIPAVQRVNNAAFTDVWGYYPIDEDEARTIANQMLTISNPRLMKVVMKGDEIAGFAFIFPDVGETLKAIGGRLWPLGWLPLLLALRQTDRFMGNGIGLLPKYQGLGASALLYAELRATFDSGDVSHCEVVQVLETNVKSLGDLNMLGVEWHKRYRVYQRPI